MKAIDKHGWTKVMFGDICKNLNLSERDPLKYGLERYIGLEHIETENLHIKTWGNVAEGTTFSKKFLAGHVLFGKRRAYLKKAALAEFDGICSGDILVFEANEKVIDKRLLPFVVSSERFFDYAVKTSAGSLSPRTKFQDLAKFEITLPPLNQQAKLAELLWAADEMVESYNKLIIQSIKIKQLYIDNFINTIFSKDIDFIPLREVMAKSNSVKATNIDRNKLITVRLHLKGVVKNETVDGLKIGSTNYFIRRAGQFIYGKQNLFNGAMGIIPNELDGYLTSTDIPTFDINSQKILPDYLLAFLGRENYYKKLEKISSGSGSKRISERNFLELQIAIPKIEKQADFINRKEFLEEKYLLLTTCYKNTQQIQKQLINQLF
jgi:type I restriction enzyme S subunit